MYKELRNKIIRYIMMSTILLFSLIGILSFLIVSISYYYNFEDSANENIRQSIRNSYFSIQAVRDSTSQISENSTIINALSTNEYNSKINQILNTIKNTSFGILGVTMYTLEGNIYSTSSISNQITLAELTENQEIAAFFTGNESTFLSIRTTHISKIYNNVNYASVFGIISYIIRLHNVDGVTGGYLIIDINPEYLFENFFIYDNYVNYDNIETYIVTSTDSIMKSRLNISNNTKYLNNLEPNSFKISSDYKYLIIVNDLYTNNTQVISLVPLKPLYEKIILFSALLIMTIAVILVIIRLIANYIANSIIEPLTRLHEKMASTNQITTKRPS